MKYIQIQEELRKIIDNQSTSSNNTILTELNDLQIVVISKNSNYQQELPKNLIVNKIPNNDESTNYIIFNAHSSSFTKKTVVSFHGNNNIFLLEIKV